MLSNYEYGLLVTTEIEFLFLCRLCQSVKRKIKHHFDQKSINHEILVIFLLPANGRAPLEPYYGRYIGNFTEFAHKIKVCLSLDYYISFTLNNNTEIICLVFIA